MKKQKKNSLDKKKTEPGQNESFYFETFRLKLKSLSIYKNHDVRIVEDHQYIFIVTMLCTN